MVGSRRDTYGLSGIIILAVLICCCVLCIPQRVWAYADMAKNRELYSDGIFDQAELFSEKETEKLAALLKSLTSEYNMNFLAMTTDWDSDMSSSQLAESFYEDMGYADDGKKGGIVLIIDMNQREMNLVTSGDMIYYITDAREERIYDRGYAYASDGKYGKAMYAMAEQVADFMGQGIPDGQYTYDTETGRIVRYKSLTLSDWIIALAGALVCAAGTCMFFFHSYGTVRPYEYSISQNAKIHFVGKQDRLVNRFVTQRRIPKNPPPSSGGGGGARTSTHTSGSGGTYGGGHGRKF